MGTVLSSKPKLFSEASYLGNFLLRGAFPTLYFDLLTNEIQGKRATQTLQAVNSLRKLVSSASLS